jgi:hypothetical protein
MKVEGLIKIVVRVTSVGYVVDIRLKGVVDTGGEPQKKENVRLLFPCWLSLGEIFGILRGRLRMRAGKRIEELSPVRVEGLLEAG